MVFLYHFISCIYIMIFCAPFVDVVVNGQIAEQRHWRAF